MPQLDEPLFSVVIPAYNCAGYIGQSISSAIKQTLGRSAVEVLVLDDGSTDDTRARVARFGNAVRFIQLQHGGVSRARNAGIEAARGRYVAFLDADDYWFPQRLERAASFLQDRRAECFLNTEFYVETGGKRSNIPYYRSRNLNCLFDLEAPAQLEFALEDNFINCMVIAPRRMLLDAGGFNPQLRYGEDWDLWLRLLEAGAPVRLVSQPCAVYRYQRPGATTTRHDLGMASDRLRVLSRYPDAVSPARLEKAQHIEKRLRLKQAVSRFIGIGRA